MIACQRDIFYFLISDQPAAPAALLHSRIALICAPLVNRGTPSTSVAISYGLHIAFIQLSYNFHIVSYQPVCNVR